MSSNSHPSKAMNIQQEKMLDSIFTDSKNPTLTNQSSRFKDKAFWVWITRKSSTFTIALLGVVIFFTSVYFFSTFLGLAEKKSLANSSVEILKKDVSLKVKVLRSGGQPVAGARLSVDGESFGVTDTFGEWEQVLSVEKDKDLSIKVSKPASSAKHRATLKTIYAKDLQNLFTSKGALVYTTAIEIQP